MRGPTGRSSQENPGFASGPKSVPFTVADGGGNSIQEYAAANPYCPPPRKTVGVRIRMSTHAQRSPSVRRHRRSILPNHSRVTARASSRTGACPLAGHRHVASTLLKVPVSPFVVLSHPGTTRKCSNDRPLPCRTVAQFRRRLPSSPSSASTQATLPFYGV